MLSFYLNREDMYMEKNDIHVHYDYNLSKIKIIDKNVIFE